MAVRTARSCGHRVLSRQLPFVPVFCASESPHGQFKVAAFYPYRLAIQQGVGDLLPGGRHHTLESGTGDAHPVRSILLFQPLQVLQSYGLSLVKGENDLFQHPHGYACWLEERGFRDEGHSPAPPWSTQLLASSTSFAGLSYEHMLITYGKLASGELSSDRSHILSFCGTSIQDVSLWKQSVTAGMWRRWRDIHVER